MGVVVGRGLAAHDCVTGLCVVIGELTCLVGVDAVESGMGDLRLTPAVAVAAVPAEAGDAPGDWMV